MNRRWWMAVVAGLMLAAGLGVSGCGKKSQKRVVLYSSVDEPYLRPILKRFEAQTGIAVTLQSDGEATKTAGIVERLEAEKSHPQADVYWGNEFFHTVNLAQAGVFEAYAPQSARDVPQRWHGAGDLYTGVGARARVIAVSTRPEHAALVGRIHNLADLADPALAGRVGISNPGFGTASGHVAALYVLWGDEKADAFMKSLAANGVKLLGGNSAVAEEVAKGNLIAGLSDNDDVSAARAEGRSIDAVLPDQGEGGAGTLAMPTTLALVKGGPDGESGRKLIEFLASAAVEQELIDAKFLAFSLRASDGRVKLMEVDDAKVAGKMRQAVERSMTILQNRTGGK